MKYISFCIIILAMFSACTRDAKNNQPGVTKSEGLVFANPDTVDILLTGSTALESKTRRLLGWLDSLRISDAPFGTTGLWADISFQLRHFLTEQQYPLRLRSALFDSSVVMLEFSTADPSSLPGNRFWLMLGDVGKQLAFVNVLTEPEPADAAVAVSMAWDDFTTLATAKGNRTVNDGGLQRTILDQRQYPDTMAVRNALAATFSPAAVESIVRRLGLHDRNGRACLIELPSTLSLDWTNSAVSIVARYPNLLELRCAVAGGAGAPDASLRVLLEMTTQGWKVGSDFQDIHTAQKQS